MAELVVKTTGVLRQHLIDPAICIRCNTCEDTCPIDAVTHDDNNYVVDASICEHCLACIAPCPTGAIDNWRTVNQAYALNDQFSWDDLPEEETIATDASTVGRDALDEEAWEILEIAHQGQGGEVPAPESATRPCVSLYTRDNPILAKVAGNFRLTDESAESDIHHIILDFGSTAMPVLEGQSIGVIPPGLDDHGRRYHMRLYSVASPRDGERPGHNNISLTVKRVLVDKGGKSFHGVASNYLCDLNKGDEVVVTGPFGSTFLMPDDRDCNLIMICTGTGAAPFRAMTERRRRNPPWDSRMLLFFGSRTPGELPYFGPLKKLPDRLLRKELVFSRLKDQPKEYVQDRIRMCRTEVVDLLRQKNTYVYICGLKGMETGVDEALADVCKSADMDWKTLLDGMRQQGRYHVETY